MATETIYTCDRCKRVVDMPRERIHTLEVKVDGYGYERADWCGDCCTSTGMVRYAKPVITDIKQPEKEPSFEDKLRLLLTDLLRDEIYEEACEAVRNSR